MKRFTKGHLLVSLVSLSILVSMLAAGMSDGR
jgi:hypothetical protein